MYFYGINPSAGGFRQFANPAPHAGDSLTYNVSSNLNKAEQVAGALFIRILEQKAAPDDVIQQVDDEGDRLLEEIIADLTRALHRLKDIDNQHHGDDEQNTGES